MLKKIFLHTSLAIFLLAISGITYAQTIPAPPAQPGLNLKAPSRDLQNNLQINGRVTERQAVIFARQQFAGNILRISLVGEGANERYQIRMENEGKVFTVFVNTTTGRVTEGT